MDDISKKEFEERMSAFDDIIEKEFAGISDADQVEAFKKQLDAVKKQLIEKFLASAQASPQTETRISPQKSMDDAAKKQLIDKLLAAAKKEIRITYQKSEDALSPFDSKIGGKPAVPDGFVWPHFTGSVLGEAGKTRPLSFLAQIDLKDVADLDETGLLPKSGMLSFFYELETMTWGFDPKDKGSAKVFYFPDIAALHAVDHPDGLEEYARLPELALHFAQHISVPGYGDGSNFDWGDYDWDDYDACASACGYELDEWGNVTKLLGYPDVIQDPMEEECEAVTRGYREGSPEDHAKISEEEKADISERSKDWILLFQMGTISDDDYELMFGDCGHIYFWIRKQDLMDRNFENIWLILQCG